MFGQFMGFVTGRESKATVSSPEQRRLNAEKQTGKKYVLESLENGYRIKPIENDIDKVAEKA